MTHQVIPAVIPSLGDARRAPMEGPVTGLRRPPPPLADLRDVGSRRFGYGFATIDSHGRVADRALMRQLGWAAGTRLHIREQSGLLLIAADANGIFETSSQGHLVLPATARHSCRLLIGDRVLLVADLHTSMVAVHPPAFIESMIAGIHDGGIGRDDR
ncbi:hypothetical protein KZZ52_41375 [Dactylosporangium sp. AC04546]|uniref:hypothetical protein n=1 Tax=Dactylosporangium sp. AC04546 TaxID=2862460 RepID=UPI001EE0B64C|nr:hypothetical protein [Dactylosporangium sp. AC04546]WVK80380.1 hypothetical protein KZZ52_41375 [Dactylosporangium sp. AC04546]